MRSALKLLVLTILLSLLATFGRTDPDIRAQVRQATQAFKDITLTCRVLYANVPELKKIGKDFPNSYEFKSTTIKYKAPDKMKIEGKLGLVTVAIVINGDIKSIRAPGLHISKKENIARQPHKRQGDLDIGIFTDQLWQDYVVTNVETEEGQNGKLYKIAFVRSNSKNKKLVLWAEPKTWKLLKLEKYEDDGTLKSRYIYSNHRRYGPIWVPGHIDVYNRDGKLAGSTMYENIKVNSGIPDSEFKP
ncbi:MAG: outer membrane lipoprotein-sorting protein [Armatimonadota bacterium]|nr:outer membrane lipoprotein-sorting protein [Armatimonadota bacterium]